MVHLSYQCRSCFGFIREICVSTWCVCVCRFLIRWWWQYIWGWPAQGLPARGAVSGQWSQLLLVLWCQCLPTPRGQRRGQSTSQCCLCHSGEHLSPGPSWCTTEHQTLWVMGPHLTTHKELVFLSFFFFWCVEKIFHDYFHGKILLPTAQPISQPPDVTNNAKSTRQADRVGHYAASHISSVRMNHSGNISGLQDDGQNVLKKETEFVRYKIARHSVYKKQSGSVWFYFYRNSTSREGFCQDPTVTEHIKGKEIMFIDIVSTLM